MILTPTRGAPRLVRVRAATVPDSYGEGVVSVWDERASRLPLPGAQAQTRATSDSPSPGTPGRSSSERVFFALGAADVEADDRIEVDGEAWRIDGDVHVLRGSGPCAVYTTCTLRRVTGT